MELLEILDLEDGESGFTPQSKQLAGQIEDICTSQMSRNFGSHLRATIA